MDQFNFAPEAIYSIDETGCTKAQKPGRVVAPKDVNQVGSSRSAVRSILLQ